MYLLRYHTVKTKQRIAFHFPFSGVRDSVVTLQYFTRNCYEYFVQLQPKGTVKFYHFYWERPSTLIPISYIISYVYYSIVKLRFFAISSKQSSSFILSIHPYQLNESVNCQQQIYTVYCPIALYPGFNFSAIVDP